MADTVAPLAPTPRTAAAAPAAAEPKSSRSRGRSRRRPRAPCRRPARLPKPPPALARIDRRTRAPISRGVAAIDAPHRPARPDAGAAHARLRRFLREAQADGAKVVLVITGKGERQRPDERRSAACSAACRRTGYRRRRCATWSSASTRRPRSWRRRRALRAHSPQTVAPLSAANPRSGHFLCSNGCRLAGPSRRWRRQVAASRGRRAAR